MIKNVLSDGIDEQLLLSHEFDFVSHEFLVGIFDIDNAEFIDIDLACSFTGMIKLETETMYNNCNNSIILL